MQNPYSREDAQWVHWAHLFFVRRHLHPDFDLVGRFCAGGIFESIQRQTGTEVRLRGRGSGNLDVRGREAPIPLMAVMGTQDPDPNAFRAAARQLVQHLEAVADEYGAYCWIGSLPMLGSEEPLFWFAEYSFSCDVILTDLIMQYPTPRHVRQQRGEEEEAAEELGDDDDGETPAEMAARISQFLDGVE